MPSLVLPRRQDLVDDLLDTGPFILVASSYVRWLLAVDFGFFGHDLAVLELACWAGVASHGRAVGMRCIGFFYGGMRCQPRCQPQVKNVRVKDIEAVCEIVDRDDWKLR